MDIFFTITGKTQGVIKGGVKDVRAPGAIAVTSFSFGSDVPIDTQTGAASGKRQHQPVTITKIVDQSTPKLFEATVTNEALAAQIDFWTNPAAAKPYMTIDLTNAVIVGYQLVSPNDVPSVDPTLTQYEEIQFTFQKIAITWTDGGITATDDSSS